MAQHTEIPSLLQRDITLMEHEAKDAIALADALKALLTLHQGRTVIGMSPEHYHNTLRSLLRSLAETDEK